VVGGAAASARGAEPGTSGFCSRVAPWGVRTTRPIGRARKRRDARTPSTQDSVTVSATAGGNLAGTVSFDFFTNGTCAGTPAWSTTKSVSGASPQTVLSGSAPAQTASGTFAWRVAYDSTNDAQRDISASCHETSALTVTNGGTVSSP